MSLYYGCLDYIMCELITTIHCCNSVCCGGIRGANGVNGIRFVAHHPLNSSTRIPASCSSSSHGFGDSAASILASRSVFICVIADTIISNPGVMAGGGTRARSHEPATTASMGRSGSPLSSMGRSGSAAEDVSSGRRVAPHVEGACLRHGEDGDRGRASATLSKVEY